MLLLYQEAREDRMLDSIRKITTTTELPVEALTTLGVVGGFLFLLTHDFIHPLLVYVLQLFLSF